MSRVDYIELQHLLNVETLDYSFHGAHRRDFMALKIIVAVKFILRTVSW